MSHIVFLTSLYLGKASANGLCAHNIIDALSEIGHDVDVICYECEENKTNEKNIFTIHNDSITRGGFIGKIISKISKAFFLLLSNPKFYILEKEVDQYYDTLCYIDKFHRIDAVVAIFFPMETAQAMARFKSTHPDARTIIYELDSLADGIAQNDTIYKLLDNNYQRWLSSLYEKIDYVIIMKSHSAYWRKVFDKRFHAKLMVSDIPVLLPKPMKPDNFTQLSFIYAGLIEKKYRSPEYLLLVLKELSTKINFTFRFYSKGDCETMISEIAKEVPGIQQKGYVPQEELDKAMSDTTFLVSIGNSISNSIPSKLISYISYMKPIIHFSSQKNDVCKAYLKDYPFSLVIDQSLSIEDSAGQIISFIESMQKDLLQDIPLNKLYEMNLPSYSANIISSLIAD